MRINKTPACKPSKKNPILQGFFAISPVFKQTHLLVRSYSITSASFFFPVAKYGTLNKMQNRRPWGLSFREVIKY